MRSSAAPSVIITVREETPNDLKLSDSGGRRDGCAVGGKVAPEQEA
jgi:hypothetical protein